VTTFDKLVSQAVDRMFGEPTRVEPMAAGELLSGGPDPARDAFDVRGVVETGAVVAADGGGRAAISGDTVFVSYRDELLPIPLQTGDRIVALGRPGTPAFVVSSVDPDGHGRTVLRCRTAGRQP